MFTIGGASVQPSFATLYKCASNHFKGQFIHVHLIILGAFYINAFEYLQQQLKIVKIVHLTIVHNIFEEESYWHKRSHAIWLHHGDHNTSYFHKLVNDGKKE
jgi:hypothetical protein